MEQWSSMPGSMFFEVSAVGYREDRRGFLPEMEENIGFNHSFRQQRGPCDIPGDNRSSVPAIFHIFIYCQQKNYALWKSGIW
jgi:hypothetical protein